MHKISRMDSRLVSPVGFSNGSAPLALKNPPPLVPSCLMTSCEATGPRGMTWLTPFSASCTVTGPASVCSAPCAMNTTAATNAIGSSTYRFARTKSTQKFPIVLLPRRENPRISATATAMPTAALRKFCTARSPICDRYDIVVSPEYACKFVLVTNDTMVFQARAGVTPGRCCGLSGSTPCSRKMA